MSDTQNTVATLSEQLHESISLFNESPNGVWREMMKNLTVDYPLAFEAWGGEVSGDGTGMYSANHVFHLWKQAKDITNSAKTPGYFLQTAGAKEFLAEVSRVYPVPHVKRVGGGYIYFSKLMLAEYIRYLDVAVAVQYTSWVVMIQEYAAKQAATLLQSAEVKMAKLEEDKRQAKREALARTPFSVSTYFHPAAILIMMENLYLTPDGLWRNPQAPGQTNNRGSASVLGLAYVFPKFQELLAELPEACKTKPFVELVDEDGWTKEGYWSEDPDIANWLSKRWGGNYRKLLAQLPENLRYDS